VAGLEPGSRGAYAGAVGYLSFAGDLDFCITIRTVVIGDGRAYVQAGAGVVADSDPQTELLETQAKVEALLPAVAPGYPVARASAHASTGASGGEETPR
jgi:anthranilate synthase component 1